MEDALETENSNLLDKLLHEKRLLSQHKAILSFPMLFSSFFTILVVSILGGYFVLRGEMHIGELFTAITLADYVVSPVMKFQNTVSQIRRAEANFSRINHFLTLPDEDWITMHVHIGETAKACSVVIHDLQFRYPNGKVVFHKANFAWEQGKLHIIIGENGTGKSSLLKLLSGIYAPQNGFIEVNGTEGKNPVKTQNLRQQIVIDTQSMVLFADTILFNLTLGHAVSQVHIESICKKVGIHKDIQSLPDGYAARLGADGAPLSGGQKWRLCLARALLRDTAVYIFDEPTTGIDSAHIPMVIETLQTLAATRLVIVITHEPSMIKAAETVTKLEGCL